MNQPDMEVGKRYRVTYRIKGLHRTDHVFVGDLIGKDGPSGYVFSLRPESGTSSLAKAHLLRYEEVAKTVKNGKVYGKPI